MATSFVKVMSSDLDGSPADETVRFALDGKNYSIDLSKDQASTLRESLSMYVKAAKKRKGGSRSGRAAEIRAWARDQGLEVPERGRIPKAIEDQYNSK